MATWDEVKLLAANFRRVQLGESAKRLSNRNCVELVAKLIGSGALELISTADGRHYVTPKHLCTEIKNEVIANNGRVALTDVQQTTGVEFRTVEGYANRLASAGSDLVMCLNQLISRDYIKRMVEEVNESLQRKGKLTLAELTQRYDLPTKFMEEWVMVQVGHQIHGFCFAANTSVIYTNAYVESQSALLRGALSGCTRLLPVKKLLSEFPLESNLIFKSLDSLISRGYICGSVLNGHHIDRAVFVPDVFMRKLLKHLVDFYRQNGYIEYAYVRRFGVGDHGQLISRALTEHKQSSQAMHLKDCVISDQLFSRLEGDAEETLSQFHWLDMNAIVPAVFTQSDVEEVSRTLAKSHTDWIRTGESNFYKQLLLQRCAQIFDGIIADKAAKEGPLLRQAAAAFADSQPAKDVGKKKGGAKGKKKKGAHDADEDDHGRPSSGRRGASMVFMTEAEIVETLQQSSLALENCPVEILNEIADHLVGELNAKYRARIDSVLLSVSDGQRKTHGEMVEKISSLYSTLRLSDIASDEFEDSVAENLRIFLLRSVATDIAHLALADFANIPNPLEITKKVRDATIKSLPSPAREYFENLTASLNEMHLNPFYDAMDRIALPSICSLDLRFPDKKSKVALVAKYVADLKSQLEAGPDCASSLLLCCLILFAKCTDNVLHASGKFVPSIVAFLAQRLPSELTKKLLQAQADVVACLKNPGGSNVNAVQSVAELKAACM